jgi:predicted negative regulator of RcsB-dependent stress response
MDDLSEREQLDAIKKWWHENGKAIIAGLVIGLGAVFGWQYWQKWQEQVAEEASALYRGVVAGTNLSAEGNTQLEALKDEHTNSPYAALAAMMVAAHQVEENQLDEARAQLQWAVDNASQSELANVSRLRLARVLWALGEGDSALSQLDAVDKPFLSIADEIRGDIYLEMGDADKARSAYQAAQGALSLKGASNPWLQMKLEDLTQSGVAASAESESQ